MLEETTMSTAAGKPRSYLHPHVNHAWLSRLREDILEPDLPLAGAPHHLWERKSGRYLLDELRADLGAGHNVRATVFIQCGYAYRSDGPLELRPVGETERVAAIANKRRRPAHQASAPALSGIAIFATAIAGIGERAPLAR